MEKYLEATEIVNWKHTEVLSLARELSKDCSSEADVAKNCFEWVRDHIRHSWDYKLDPVTCKASDVLKYRTGYCFAKSHLLAALLRANNMPAGFCYQRLSKEGDGEPYILHGLNAVYLLEHGWYRIDARGNKEGVNAQFAPPKEHLAFSPAGNCETDLPEIYSSPLRVVIEALQRCSTHLELYESLPDAKFLQEQAIKK